MVSPIEARRNLWRSDLHNFRICLRQNADFFMPQTKEQKQKIIEDLKEKIARQKAIIFIDFKGLKVKALSSLKKRLKTTDSRLKVAKKTLTQIALKDLKGETLQNFDIQNLTGQVGLVFGFKDEISPAKIIWQFSRENPNLKILGGILENKFVEAEMIIELAQLPTKEQLLGRLAGSISAPISNFVNVLEANIKGLIYLLTKIKA